VDIKGLSLVADRYELEKIEKKDEIFISFI
jgi:hypothetical protein